MSDTSILAVRRWAYDVRRSIVQRVRRQTALGHLPRGWGWGGALWQSAPVRRDFGFRTGQCIDRYYIERFLASHAGDVKGRVLEIADATYTRRFGGSNVIESDVLHREAGHPGVTIVDDLARPAAIPRSTFDCIIFTQTLQFIDDVRATLRTLHDSLSQGGVLLLTVPCISQLSRYDADRWGEYWRFTVQGAERLLSEVFPADSVAVQGYGNVLAATALLHGIVANELRREDLEVNDPDYVVTVAARAVKPAAATPGDKGRDRPAAILEKAAP